MPTSDLAIVEYEVSSPDSRICLDLHRHPDRLQDPDQFFLQGASYPRPARKSPSRRTIVLGSQQIEEFLQQDKVPSIVDVSLVPALKKVAKHVEFGAELGKVSGTGVSAARASQTRCLLVALLQLVYCVEVGW